MRSDVVSPKAKATWSVSGSATNIEVAKVLSLPRTKSVGTISIKKKRARRGFSTARSKGRNLPCLKGPALSQDERIIHEMT